MRLFASSYLLFLPALIAQTPDVSVKLYDGWLQMFVPEPAEQTTSIRKGGNYTLEFSLPQSQGFDYVIRYCNIEPPNKVFITGSGCPICDNTTVFRMVETANYTMHGAHKRSLVHLVAPQHTYLTIECHVEMIFCTGCASRSCANQNALSISKGTLMRHVISYPTSALGGLLWWHILLIVLGILLLLLLLLCCIVAIVLFLKKNKNKKEESMNVGIAYGTKIEAIGREQKAESLKSLDTSKAPTDVKDAQIVSDIGHPKQKEFFSGHAGLYDVRDPIGTHYDKNPRHQPPEVPPDFDRNSYHNYAYEPDVTRWVGGFDEVVRYDKDLDIEELNHVQREMQTPHRYAQPPIESHRRPSGRWSPLPV